MTTKYVQKGKNNKDKKYLKLKTKEDLYNSIDEDEIIKDWYGYDGKRPLTGVEFTQKYGIPDSRYLFDVLDHFNLERRTPGESNRVIGLKRKEEAINNLTLGIDIQKFKDLYPSHTHPELKKLFGISDRDLDKILKYLDIAPHTRGESQTIAQSHMSKEKKKEISDKRLSSITPEVEANRVAKIQAARNAKSDEEIADIYRRAAEKNKSRTPEQKRASKDKEYETRVNNGTLWTSSPEDRFYDNYLVPVYGKDNVEREYNKDPRYPHRCDFYIHSLDLFIELNFHPSHWAHYKYKEPFDPDNKEHIEWCKLRKELGYSTHVWKYLDRQKIQDAYDNNLNYIAFYDQKSFENDEDIVYSLAKVKGVHIVPGAH